MKIQSRNSWYTILLILMIIGFLMVLTTWIFNLLLRELNDNKWEADYLKAYAWAESAMELALLDIKKNWYWFYNKKDDLEYLETSKSKIKFSYDLNSKTDNFSQILEPFEQTVIPLFYEDTSLEEVKNIELSINNSYPDYSNMAWNIISWSWAWLWGTWLISANTVWEWRDENWSFISSKKLNWNWNFLDTYNKNYLLIVNLDSYSNLEYKLSSTDEFTKPVSKIFSSAKIWKYRQNLETSLDNSEFLSILKYSIFSK